MRLFVSRLRLLQLLKGEQLSLFGGPQTVQVRAHVRHTASGKLAAVKHHTMLVSGASGKDREYSPEETPANIAPAALPDPSVGIHPDAVPRAAMDRDKRYTLWQRVGSGWVMERSLGGGHVRGDDSYWEGIRDRAASTRPLAFFPEGYNPGKGYSPGASRDLEQALGVVQPPAPAPVPEPAPWPPGPTHFTDRYTKDEFKEITRHLDAIPSVQAHQEGAARWETQMRARLGDRFERLIDEPPVAYLAQRLRYWQTDLLYTQVEYGGRYLTDKDKAAEARTPAYLQQFAVDRILPMTRALREQMSFLADGDLYRPGRPVQEVVDQLKAAPRSVGDTTKYNLLVQIHGLHQLAIPGRRRRVSDREIDLDDLMSGRKTVAQAVADADATVAAETIATQRRNRGYIRAAAAMESAIQKIEAAGLQVNARNLAARVPGVKVSMVEHSKAGGTGTGKWQVVVEDGIVGEHGWRFLGPDSRDKAEAWPLFRSYVALISAADKHEASTNLWAVMNHARAAAAVPAPPPPPPPPPPSATLSRGEVFRWTGAQLRDAVQDSTGPNRETIVAEMDRREHRRLSKGTRLVMRAS